MKKRKGIILAGGNGSRLYPLTKSISKHLPPVYDKPMIYYPLSVLMIAGIKEILIISTLDSQIIYKSLLGDGSFLGISISYDIQEKPRGLADAFIIGENFLDSSPVCMILGDNIFYGQGLKEKLNNANQRSNESTIFAYQVNNPSEFGVVEFDNEMNVVSVEEKPEIPKSNFAITGLYFYDNQVSKIAKNIKPSSRGELEITDINKYYLKKKQLKVEEFGRGFAWLDAGTQENLIQAGLFVQTIEKRQGLKIACIEEIACRNKWIDSQALVSLGKKDINSSYGKYLIEIGNNLLS